MCVVFTFPTGNLRTPRRRGVGAERGSRGSQMALNTHYERMRTAEHAPPDPFRVLERRLDLAEIGERGGGVVVERLRVTPPHPERELMTIAEDASRHGHRFAQQ